MNDLNILMFYIILRSMNKSTEIRISIIRQYIEQQQKTKD